MAVLGDKAWMTTDTPNPIDVHVGRRVRLRRQALNLSQERLADSLGLSFQQVQKYERGTNRISASKLFEISRTLRTPVGFFYEGLDDPGAPEGGDYTLAWSHVLEELLAEPNGRALADAYLAIRRQSVRRALVDFVRLVAASDRDGLSPRAAAE